MTKRLTLVNAITLLSMFALLGVSACAQLQVTQMSMNYPPRPPDCALEYVSLQPSDLAAYKAIGRIDLIRENHSHYTEALKSRLQKHACELGGDTVSFMASAGGTGGAGYSSFLVLAYETDSD